MPFKSLAQEGYFHTHEKELAKQGVNVHEWDQATKGKHLPQRAAAGGPIVNKGHRSMEASFAKGGAVQDAPAKDFKKDDPQGRGEFGKFLGTENRFSGGAIDRRVQGDPESRRTEEVWPKGKGVGRTEHDDQGDDKSLPPVKPRK